VKSDLAHRFQEECGAVVYAKHSTTKQMGFLYNCVKNFVNSLEGSVLVVGDNGGAIAYRTQFQHTYTMYRGELEFDILKENVRPGCLVHPDEFESLLIRKKFDHVVVFLYSYDFVFPKDAKVHYCSLLPGNAGISITDKTNEFLISGKIATFHPYPVGDLVCHTSLFPVYDPLDHFVVWRTSCHPTNYVSSIAPLTNIARLGPINEVMISDKIDGVPFYLDIRANVAILRNSDAVLVQKWEVFGLPNQILVLEKVAPGEYYVVEPLYVSGCATFGDWLLKGNYLKSNTIKFKRWHPFPVDFNWQQYAKSNEGVVLKSKKSICGFRDSSFRKLCTYYLKLPDRVSYEDYVGSYPVPGGSTTLLRGYHNVYTDPLKIMDVPGVYEVKVCDSTLFRRRAEKKFADPTWYVEAVCAKIDFNLVFTLPLNFVRFLQTPDQGLSGIRTIKSHNVVDSHLIDIQVGGISVNFRAEVGSLLNYCGKFYVVKNSFEGHSVATTRTDASLMG